MTTRHSTMSLTVLAAAFIAATTLATSQFAGGSDTRHAGAATAAPSVWTTAVEVPGMSALNLGNARASTISCPAVGWCAAGGSAGDGAGHSTAIVANQVLGHWRSAAALPGGGAFAAGSTSITSISCPTTTFCSAVGDFVYAGSLSQAIVANEVNGVWQKIQSVPGLATLNSYSRARLNVISCRANGACSAGGYYVDSSQHQRAFVANEVNGNWQQATPVPGTLALSNGGNAQVSAMSCWAPGNCSAGGYINGGSNHAQPFVVNEANGLWGLAVVLIDDGTFNNGGRAAITALSCGSAGNCTGGGFFRDHSTNQQAFLVNEVAGTWYPPFEVPGTASLNTTAATINAVSCYSSGNCVAGGYFTGASGRQQPFLIAQDRGDWGLPNLVVNSSSPATNTQAQVTAVTCESTGFCLAGGFFTAPHNHLQTFAMIRVGSSWASSSVLSGTVELNAGNNATVTALSCPTSSFCGALGTYVSSTGKIQDFVANRASAPSAPLGVLASAGRGVALVSWRAPATNGGTAVTAYQVISSPGGHICTTSGALACNVKGLTANHAYSFAVIAINAAGASTRSASSRIVLVH